MLKKNLWVLLSALLVTACGGGGGGGDNGVIDPPNPPPVSGGVVVLSDDNAVEVTRAVVQALGSTSAVPLGVEVTASYAIDDLAVIVSRFVHRALTAAAVANLPAGVEVTLDCSISGSITSETELGPDPASLEGSVIRITYDNCVEGFTSLSTTTLDGTVISTTEVSEGNILTNVYRTVTTIEFLNYSFSFDDAANPELSGSGTFNGSSTFETEADGQFITTTTVWDELSTVFNGVAQDLDNFTTTTRCTINFLECTVSGGGTAEVPSFEGTVTFEYDEYNGPRQAGVVDIFGADGSYIQCVAGTITVDLNIDTDGDGNFDEFVQTSWDVLLSGT